MTRTQAPKRPQASAWLRQAAFAWYKIFGLDTGREFAHGSAIEEHSIATHKSPSLRLQNQFLVNMHSS